MQAKPQVIIVTGPTAVGKTGVGLDVALALNGEVISADSVQVYKGLDVGSDKLPVSERKGVPHHLIDVLEVHEDYSAGRFHDEAWTAISDIVARGRTPIVVGGTGFYLRFLQEGKPKAGKTTPEIAAAMKEAIQKVWQEEALRLGVEGGADSLSPPQKWDSAVKLLGAWGDEDAMHKIAQETNNYYRLERALAVIHLTGRKRAEVDIGAQAQDSIEETEDSASDSSSGTSQQHAQDLDFRPFFLHRDRELLYRRCNARVADMVLGLRLLDEAAMLLRKGITSNGGAAPGSMAGRAVGYRQAIEWMLQIADAEAVKREDVVELVEAICGNTHKLVRHQMTWFRDNGTYKWIDMDALDEAAKKGAQASSKDAAVAIILESVKQPCHEGYCPANSGRLDKKQVKRLNVKRGHSFKDVVASAAAEVAGASKRQKQQQQRQKRSSSSSSSSSSRGQDTTAAAAAAAETRTQQQRCGNTAEAGTRQEQQGSPPLGQPSQGEASREQTNAAAVAASANGGPAAEAKEAGNVKNGSQARSPDLLAEQRSYMGRTAGQLLADLDAVAAYVSSVLLPQLRSNATFQELQAQARAERHQAETAHLAKVEEHRRHKAERAEERRRHKADKDKQQMQ